MSEPLRNPQIPSARYDQFVAAAITGILAGKPTITVTALAKQAHNAATAVIEEENLRDYLIRQGYSNLYVALFAGLVWSFIS